jgi:hypothetical protein
LSQRLTAWRRLLGLGDWPSGASDLELGATIVAVLRDTVTRDIADGVRRQAVIAEIARGARDVWFHAARESVRGNVDVAAVFDRMDRFGIDERSLEGPMAYNLRLWRLKQEAEKETDIEVLRRHRDEFTTAVQALGVVTSAPEAQAFLQKLGKIELSLDLVENVAQAATDRSGLGSLLKRVDPRRLIKGATRQPTLSPRVAGWREEPAEAGLRVTATWNSGGRAVKLDFLLVQPDDATPPFYLAQRVIAVGEFLDLVAGRPEDGQKVLAALPAWTRSDTLDKPWNKPMAWRPRSDFRGLELNPTWFYLADAQVKALFDNAELRARTPVLDRLVTDKPTARSPLQQLPPEAAQVFARTLLGARLPRPEEWRAVTKQAAAAAPSAHFRGRSFEELWHFLDQYREGGQTVRWRPNEGVFLPLVAAPDGGARRLLVDEGHARPDVSADGLWLAPVDDGPTIGGFVNLIGNVWIYLYDDAARQFYVAGGSALSPPGLDLTEPLKVEVAGRIGARAVTEGFSDVGLRPAFDAPPGVRERFELLRLVREQKYLVF